MGPPRIVSLLRGTAAEAASYAFWAIGSEPIIPALPAPTEPEDTLLYVHHLTAICDVLVMPLGLDNAVSLFIARQVHQQDVPFRTVLFTGSFTATPETTVPLFDHSLSSRSMGLAEVLKSAAGTPAPPRLTVDAAERQIGRLIRTESCFASFRHEDKRQSIEELRARDRRYVAAMAELTRARSSHQIYSLLQISL